jgi:hypothetical protein
MDIHMSVFTIMINHFLIYFCFSEKERFLDWEIVDHEETSTGALDKAD